MEQAKMNKTITTKAEIRKKKRNSGQNGTLYSSIIPIPGKTVQNSVAYALNSMKPTLFNISKNILQNLTKFNQRIVQVSTFMILTGAAILFFILQPQFEQFNNARIDSGWGFAFLIITLSLVGFRLMFFLYQVFLVLKYKAIPSVSDKLLPTCTVIVPAYNEGELVYHTLLSVADSLYPEEKLQLIAIDDGSKDDTWYWMQQAKVKLGNRLAIYQQPKNMGKRHALYRGFHLAIGEIFVTIDSDSIIVEDTLRNLVSPFVTNKNCGAVAGNVQVLNNQKSLIPKMLNVSFVFSFEFVRSAESSLGSVLCTPGALSAYRGDAVFDCLEDWMNQTFMGKPSDIGEDRAMTNMILKQGHEVLFQKNAIVLTNVPEKYKGLYRMFIRWGRSNVRENLMMAKYVFKKFRNESRVGPRLLFINQFFSIIMSYPTILFMVFFLLTFPVLFVTSALFSILILSSISVFFYAKRYNLKEAFWAYSYGILFAFGLFWIMPYSIATAGKSGWLTRG
jgi:hyaluronan synthase